MAEFLINKTSKPRQYLYSILVVLFTAVICYAISQYVGYKVIAFILLITVSLIATLFDILPVLLAAALSALVWDYFFIPPHFTLSVTSTEDLIFLLMYFVIALVNAVLTYKIRQVEKIARAKDEKANQLKLYDTLLSSLSHELRTPIAAIIGATDNLQTNSANLTIQHKEELVDEISKASLRLNRQVDNLLNISRLESGFAAPKTDWCDINELLYQVVARVEDNNIKQTLTINIDPELPLFKVDKAMLEEVMYNLLNNAAIYTPADSIIKLSANSNADVLQVIVEDNGAGFKQEDISKVFDKFYRAGNTGAGGLGLGLSIVKGFTEAMGGTVALTNKAEGGAQFTISIAAPTSYLKNMKNE